MTNKQGAFARMAAAVAATTLSLSAGAGTVGLLKDLAADEVIGTSDPWYLGVSGNAALFAASVPGEQGRALFRTDGTANGTARVNVAGIVDPGRAGAFGNRVLVIAYTTAAHAATRLWISDGTDAGTTLLRELGDGERTVARFGASSGGREWLCMNSNVPFQGCELFRSDGTAAGTVPVATSRRVTLTHPDGAGGLYFYSSDVSGGDFAIWHTDGTDAGTRPLHTIASLGFTGLGPIAWVDANYLYLNASLPTLERGVFRVHIQSGAVVQLSPNGFSSFAMDPVEMGGARYYIMDDVLWRSDGTPGGTLELTAAPLPYTARNPLHRLGNRLVFSKNDAASGDELWVSDGTMGGTQVLVDATPGAGGSVAILAATADRVFFLSGENDVWHFWVTDGTPAGTRMIPQRGGGAYVSQGPGSFPSGTVVGDNVYLQAAEHLQNGAVNQRLWVTNLTGTDVLRLSYAGTQLQPFGDRVLYSNWADEQGNEPWISDGSAAGTARVVNLAVTGQTDHSSPWAFERVGSRVFFTAQDRDHGRELWVTEGTTDNTRRLTDINPGEGHAMPLDSRLEGAGGLLYFIASPTLNSGDETLWRSDGTEAGTFSLGGISAHAPQCGRWTAEWNGRVWFFGRTGQGALVELWSTDGSVAGTRRELELPPEIRFLPPCNLNVTASGIVFASGYVATAGTLWRTDGTDAGTIRLGGILPAGAGPGPGSLPYFAKAGGFVYLLAEDVSAGRELWRTDGTPAGTTLVADLTPGDAGAQDFAIGALGTGVLFSYRSAPGTVNGLWRIATPGAVPERIKAGTIGTRLPLVGNDRYFTFEDSGTQSLWITDGTAAGSREVVNPGAGQPLGISQFAAGDTFLFFGRTADASGEQVWFTNGQASGTHKLSNFAAGTFSMNPDTVVLNDRAIFYRDDNVHGGEPFIVVNQPPVAMADAASTASGTAVVVNVRANDTDPDSVAAIVALSIVTQPASGAVAAEGASYRYTPNAGFAGTDSFDYRLTDEFGAQSAVVKVTITVAAPPSSGGGGGGGGKKKGGGALDAAMLALMAILAASLGAGRRRLSTRDIVAWNPGGGNLV
jgi:ELWxxDGT repeat protein